jgi:hypothetical protein
MYQEYPLPWDVPVEETAQQRQKKQRAIIKQYKARERKRKVLGYFADVSCFRPLQASDIVLDPTL